MRSTPRSPLQDSVASLDRLRTAVVQAAHLLPAQGPIGVFIHHNTLHAFDHLPFPEALQVGRQVFGSEPYLSETRYRDELRQGRMRFSELRAVLRADLGVAGEEHVLPFCTRLALRTAMLQYARVGRSDPELAWAMAESDALEHFRPEVSEVDRLHVVTETRHWVMRRFRPAGRGRTPRWFDELSDRFALRSMEKWSDAAWEAFSLSILWKVCQDGIARVPLAARPPALVVRHRDALLARTAVDTDTLVQEPLIRLCAAFLDQGMGHFSLPERDRGLFAAFGALFGLGGPPGAAWMEGLRAELQRQEASGLDALGSLADSLERLGVAPDEWEAYLSATLLALRGWAGMIWHVEQRGDRVHHRIPAGSLVEFLAVRLLLERFALGFVARTEAGFRGELWELRAALAPPPAPGPSPLQRTFDVFQLAQALSWLPERLERLRPEEWAYLVEEIEAFSELDRRRLFQMAYERRFQVQALDALAVHRPEPQAGGGALRPAFQAVFCIDEREESIRRHVEETAPDAETFGAAGFFGVAMYYRGAAAADFVPLCPVVVQPRHWVSEEVDVRLRADSERRSRHRRRLGIAMLRFDVGTRTPFLGAFLSAGLGVLATVPLVARLLLPRLTGQFRDYFRGLIDPPPATYLRLEREGADTGPEPAGQGFTIAEQSAIAERLLRDIGLTQRFARLVFLLGHGSTSMNNPHESAHDCGACGGGAGGPNARAVAQMLNDPRVRAALGERGLAIPPDTVVLGGIHNTSNDTIRLFDIDLARLPPSHQDEFAAAQRALEEACTRNAHERCRRFVSASLALAPAAARRHVAGRAEDLSQVRPEWGHATNALCVVGRRVRTRGLFLDRRSFLVSYDPESDDAQQTILTRILQAVVPVCSGINLEYYFSYVDSPGWGSGSKLPHNITSLLGVMDGAASDLRTGLPWQMVEIHEPVRLLFAIEATTAALEQILERNPGIHALVGNGWVHLAALDPAGRRISLWRDGAFQDYLPEADALPTAPSSSDWYAGWRDPLGFATIRPSEPRREDACV